MLGTREMAFVVFVIHALSEAWGYVMPKTYALLKESGAITDYIVPCYDVLHSCGREYLVEDITGYLSERGITV